MFLPRLMNYPYNVLQLTEYENSLGQQNQRSARNDFPYIAAKFSRENLRTSFDLGDGQLYEAYLNRPIVPGKHYRVFVRAYVDNPNMVICFVPCVGNIVEILFLAGTDVHQQ